MTKPATSSTAPPPTCPAPATPAPPKTSSSPEMAPSARPTTQPQRCLLPHLPSQPTPSAPRSKVPARQTQMRLPPPQADQPRRLRLVQREAPQAPLLPLRQEAPREALLQILAAALHRAPEILPPPLSLRIPFQASNTSAAASPNCRKVPNYYSPQNTGIFLRKEARSGCAFMHMKRAVQIRLSKVVLVRELTRQKLI